MAENMQAKIVSLSKTINSRLRRLRNAGLVATSQARLNEMHRLNSQHVTAAGYVSTSTKGLTEKQIQAKYKWMQGILADTETVAQAEKNIQIKMEKWNVTRQQAIEYIEAGRVFYQAVGYKNGLFDSDQVQKAIEEFSKTPDLPDLIDKLYEKYGQDLQDEKDGRDLLLKWMNRTGIIPPNVLAHWVGNEIVYDTE